MDNVNEERKRHWQRLIDTLVRLETAVVTADTQQAGKTQEQLWQLGAGIARGHSQYGVRIPYNKDSQKTREWTIKGLRAEQKKNPQVWEVCREKLAKYLSDIVLRGKNPGSARTQYQFRATGTVDLIRIQLDVKGQEGGQ